MVEENKYVFGPVPSRRLGLSLGVDIVPFKVCTLDCIYCQLGRTTEKSVERKDYVPVEVVLAELRQRLEQGPRPDFITISGSGEPTLNSRLGELIDGIKKITDIPVAILTNGTLLYRSDVRADCAKADVVLPSLDAGDEQTFRKINRPYEDICIEKLVAGLCAFREEFAGQIWLEVFLVEGLNTDSEQIGKIKELIKRICPDKVQLNTAVRPAAEAGVERPDAEKLQTIAEELGERCEVIADFSLERSGKSKTEGLSGYRFEGRSDAIKDIRGHSGIGVKMEETLLSMLKRRPCSLSDICSGLGLNRNEAKKYITHLQQKGFVEAAEKDGTTFFKAN
jgi:wyosine [tRNA(Phe)-imidazoG37] synthetase (radical SAM superfamily)